MIVGTNPSKDELLEVVAEAIDRILDGERTVTGFSITLKVPFEDLVTIDTHVEEFA